MRQLYSALSMCGALVVGLASCSNTDNMAPWTAGGPGQIVPLNNDAGHADAARDAAKQTSSSGGHGGTALGTGGTMLGTGGAGGGSAGSQGAAGAGGAAGNAVVDDPCTACEKSRCRMPDLSMDVTGPGGSIPHALLMAAYEVCFTGTGWPSAIADPAIGCYGGQTEQGATAINGPASGTAKTTLCQALLKCVHQSNCAGGQDDEPLQCYCGAGVSLMTCESAGFAPTGACVSQVAAALELTDFATSTNFTNDLCLAYGSAFWVYGYCDLNCCETECGITPSGYEDTSFCNATSSGGVSGTGGTTGTGGVHGTGGTTGTGGVRGTGGATGTGGVIGTGGVASTGGTTGTAGGAGASGAAGSGLAGSIGSTGGSSGSGGVGGVQNGRFNTNAAGWTPSSGATVSWSTNDAGSSAQSGSLDLTLTGDAAIGLQADATQCISASPGTTYNLDVDIFIPTGSSGYAALWFYGSTDCSGSALSVVASTPSFATVTAWQEVYASASAPSGAHSVAVHLQLEKSVGQSSGEALFDNVMVTSP